MFASWISFSIERCAARVARFQGRFVMGSRRSPYFFGDWAGHWPEVRQTLGAVLIMSWWSPVVGLLLRSFPSAIARSVVSFVVNATKGMRLARRVPHIRKKVFEVAPALTNRNATTAVVRILRVTGFETPPLHFVPGYINTGLAKPMLEVSVCRPGWAGPTPAGVAPKEVMLWGNIATASTRTRD